MTIMLKLTVAKRANAFMILWAHTKEMVANASGRAESFTPAPRGISRSCQDEQLVQFGECSTNRYCKMDLTISF